MDSETIALNAARDIMGIVHRAGPYSQLLASVQLRVLAASLDIIKLVPTLPLNPYPPTPVEPAEGCACMKR